MFLLAVPMLISIWTSPLSIVMVGSATAVTVADSTPFDHVPV
jgi:hypothetical protein